MGGGARESGGARDLVLVAVEVRGLHQVADGMTPQAMSRLLSRLLTLCEEAFHGSEGEVLRWEPSLPGGCLGLIAWPTSARTRNEDSIGRCEGLLRDLRSALAASVTEAVPTQVLIGLGGGRCFWIPKPANTMVLGAPVSRLLQLLGQSSSTGDAFLVDPEGPGDHS